LTEVNKDTDFGENLETSFKGVTPCKPNNGYLVDNI